MDIESIESLCVLIDSFEEQCMYCQETNDLSCCIFGNTYIVLCTQCLFAKNYRKEKDLTCYVCHEKIDDFKFIYHMGMHDAHSGEIITASKAPVLMISSPECVRHFTTMRKRCPIHRKIKYHKICVNCGTKSENMKKCSQCKSARYCSSECQRADWKKHKKICKHFALT